MKRLIPLVPFVLAACGESSEPTATEQPAVAFAVDQLITVCQTQGNGGTTLAVAAAAADRTGQQNMVRGPCPPAPVSPAPNSFVFQLPGTVACAAAPFGIGSSLAFSWRPARDPQGRTARFDVEVARAGAAPLITASTPASSLSHQHCGTVLDTLDSWSWRVRAVDHSGLAGPWSAAVPIRFHAIVLPPPGLVFPPDRAVFNHFPRLTPVQWTPVSYAASYQVEWGYCEGPAVPDWWASCTPWSAPIFIAAPTTLATIDFVGMQPGRWRVRGITADGLQGPWSDFRYFLYLQ